MNKTKYLFFTVILTASVSGYVFASNDMESLMIQKDGIITSFGKAIAAEQGKISPVVGTDSYFIDMSDSKYTVDFKSSQSVSGAVLSIFPSNIKVNISFISVQPNKKIYFDDSYLNVITDKHGNAIIADFYPEPGLHRIELKDSDRIVANAKLVINAKSNVKCSGEFHMKCLIVK